MSNSRFASVRRLFGGTALSSPAEDDEHEDAGAGADTTAGKGGPAAGPSEAQVAAVVASERAAAANEATKAANDRWNAVMSSDAGKANPKAAARLLNTTTMSADDVNATLDDLGGAAATTERGQQQQQDNRRTTDRDALANDADARPDTGAAGGSPSQRRGEGDDKIASTRTRREQRAQQRNKPAEAAGGRKANA